MMSLVGNSGPRRRGADGRITRCRQPDTQASSPSPPREGMEKVVCGPEGSVSSVSCLLPSRFAEDGPRPRRVAAVQVVATPTPAPSLAAGCPPTTIAPLIPLDDHTRTQRLTPRSFPPSPSLPPLVPSPGRHIPRINSPLNALIADPSRVS